MASNSTIATLNETLLTHEIDRQNEKTQLLKLELHICTTERAIESKKEEEGELTQSIQLLKNLTNELDAKLKDLNTLWGWKSLKERWAMASKLTEARLELDERQAKREALLEEIEIRQYSILTARRDSERKKLACFFKWAGVEERDW